MKKLFGILLAALFVFCIAGSASATLMRHGDIGKCLGSMEIKPIHFNLGQIGNLIGPRCGTGPEIGPIGPGFCGLMPNLFTGCGNIDFRFCQRPPCDGKPVPEPATMLLFGAGLAGLGVFRKKFKKA